MVDKYSGDWDNK